MISEPGRILVGTEVARWHITRLAAALVRQGVPADTVMRDCREGCDLPALDGA